MFYYYISRIIVHSTISTSTVFVRIDAERNKANIVVALLNKEITLVSPKSVIV